MPVRGKLMPNASRNIERARQEIAQLHGELLQLEKRVDIVRESFRKAIEELFGTDRQAFPALHEAALAAKIAEAVISRLPVDTWQTSVGISHRYMDTLSAFTTNLDFSRAAACRK
jgi:hypothetical protein